MIGIDHLELESYALALWGRGKVGLAELDQLSVDDVVIGTEYADAWDDAAERARRNLNR